MAFYSLATTPRQIDLFDKDIIFFPVNLANMHWVLAVINKRKKRFEYYDSLAGPDPGVLAVSAQVDMNWLLFSISNFVCRS